MFSISEGVTTLKSSITFPSNNIKGLLSPLVDIPRILMLEALPGAPDCVVILTPATCPCKACSILVGASSSIVWLETTDTAPVISFF